MRWLTLFHAIGVGVLWHFIWNVSEQWWVGSVLTFLPRLPWLAASILVLCMSVAFRSRAFWVNLAIVAFVLVSIVGFNIPWRTLGANPTTVNSPESAPQLLRVVSANVQNFQPDFATLLREVLHAKPDVVAFQEAFRLPQSLSEHFPDWHSVHVHGYWVGSRWPVRLLGQCDSDVYERATAISVEVQAPFGSFVVTDLHLMTARKSLVELKPKAMLLGDGPELVNAALLDRDEEARQTHSFLMNSAASLPTIIVGDFNMPTSSSIFQTYFGRFTNAFEATAWGCGYTAPCRRISFWPANTPWQRIDHILADSHWQVLDCHIGQRDGSDHRLIAATLLLSSRERPSPKQQSLPKQQSDGPPDLSDEVNRLR